MTSPQELFTKEANAENTYEFYFFNDYNEQPRNSFKDWDVEHSTSQSILTCIISLLTLVSSSNFVEWINEMSIEVSNFFIVYAKELPIWIPPEAPTIWEVRYLWLKDIDFFYAIRILKPFFDKVPFNQIGLFDTSLVLELGPSIALSLLTSFLYFIVACYYYQNVDNFIKYKSFILFTVLGELSLMVTFLTANFFVFYTLFEFILIPFFFIVLLWGSRINRISAAFRLIFFTLVFSGPLTIVIATNLYNNHFSFDFDMLQSTLATNTLSIQLFFYISALLAFAVKIPMFPAHVWLPEAHGEAPTFGSVLLAGVLLKLGGYGFYRIFFEFVDPNWTIANVNFFAIVYTISIITILYSNIVVFSQLDIKRTIAYYSIGHIGFVTLGYATSLIEGSTGANLIILAHGLSAAGLFFCVGYLYEQTHTRSILAYRGIAVTIPYFSTLLFFFICANVSLPGSLNFIGEQIVLISLTKVNAALATLPLLGVLLNGLSSFLFLLRICFGEQTETSVKIKDISIVQTILLSVLFFPVIYFGFFSSLVTELF